MALLLEKYKLKKQEEPILNRQNCLGFVNKLRMIVNAQEDINEDFHEYSYYFKEKVRYNTECPEFESFVNMTNNSNNKIKISNFLNHPFVDYIHTNVDIGRDLVTYELGSHTHHYGGMGGDEELN